MVKRVVAELAEDAPNHIELLSEEDEEAQVASRAKTDERIQNLRLSLLRKRQDAIEHRAGSGVESRWREDLAAYHGEESFLIRPGAEDKLNASSSKGQRTQSRRSTQYVQKTRQKTNAGSARLSDMLLPTDDRNWEYEPTPVPELMDAVRHMQDVLYQDPQTGQPLEHPDQPPPPPPTPENPQPQQPPTRMLTLADMAAETMKVARERAKRMQAEVDDQLTECQYNAACRRAIDSAAQLGTGILRGPVPMNRVKKKWLRRKGEDGKSFFELEVLEETRPQTTFVSVWDAFPAPGCGENIHDGGYFWHRDIVGPSVLKDLARLEKSGYMPDQILECLKESPMRSRAIGSPDAARLEEDGTLADKTNYEIWNFWGEADPEDLEAMGVDMDAAHNDDLRLQSVAVVVSICNDRIIRVILNPQSKGEIPFDFFQWETVSGSPWGVGIPFLMRYAQKAMNAAWRQMQDNAGVSHGPQIILNRDKIVPANSEWEIHGMKIWYALEDVDPRMVFGVHHIPSNQVELQNIFSLASQLADDETSLPQMLQGDGAPDKVGVAVMQQNNANVVLKRFARNWDDKITGPHLRRYYDWNMEFNENEEIKGDFNVVARGSTHLVVREIRQQGMMLAAQMRAQDPAVNEWLNPEKFAKSLLELTSLGDLMFTESEKMENDRKKAEQPPPQNPVIQVAQIKAQTEMAKVQADAQSEQANIALRAEEAGRNDERELAILDKKLQMTVLEYALKRDMNLDQIKAEIAQLLITTRTKQSLERENREATHRQQEVMGRFELAKEARRDAE